MTEHDGVETENEESRNQFFHSVANLKLRKAIAFPQAVNNAMAADVSVTFLIVNMYCYRMKTFNLNVFVIFLIASLQLI